MRHWTELADAAEAIDILLGQRIAKADDPFLSPAGFDQQVRRFTVELARVVRTAESAALKRVASGLKKRWRSLDTRARSRAISAAMAAIGRLPGAVVPALRDVVEQRSRRLIAMAMKEGAQQASVDVITSLNLVDEQIVQYTRTHQAFFVTNHYQRAEAALSAKARTLVSSGLQNGFDNITIGRSLADAIGPDLAARSNHYFRTVASIYTARARSYGHLRSFEAGGISTFIFRSLLDTNTTDVCRFMDGKMFSVARGLDKYQQMADLEDPDDVKKLSPFVQRSVGKDGPTLYFKRGNSRILVANVTKSGAGKAGATGSYSRAMSADQLQSSGISEPPLHGL